jgi:hypothetical protein
LSIACRRKCGFRAAADFDDRSTLLERSTMLNLLSFAESMLYLQVVVLGGGLATFYVFVSYGTDPICNWYEWADGHVREHVAMH